MAWWNRRKTKPKPVQVVSGGESVRINPTPPSTGSGGGELGGVVSLNQGGEASAAVNRSVGKGGSGGGSSGSSSISPSTSTPTANDLVIGTKDKPVETKVSTLGLTPAERLKKYYESADIKLKGYLPKGITPTEAAIRLNKPSPTEQWFGGQPTTETTYLGNKEITFTSNFVTAPSYYGQGTPIITPNIKVEEIKPQYTKADYTPTGIIRGFEETLPVVGIPLTSLNKQVYVPDKESLNKYNSLITTGDARKLNNFLAEQNAQLKKDMGRYNYLMSLDIQDEKTINEINTLANRINIGQIGTTYDVLSREARTMESRDENLQFFGRDIKPSVALGGLALGVSAYNVEKEVLGFQVGGSLAGGFLSGSKAGLRILTGIDKVTKPLNKLVLPTATIAGGVEGARMYKETGYLPYAVGSGLGTGLGFFGSIYSKEITEGISKGAKRIDQLAEEYFTGKPTESDFLFVSTGVPIKTKVRTKQVQVKKEKTKVSSQDLQDYLNYKVERKWNNERQEFDLKYSSNLSYNEKVEKVRALVNELKRTGKDTPENLNKLKDLIKNTYGEEFINSFYGKPVGGSGVRQETIQTNKPILEQPTVSENLLGVRTNKVTPRIRPNLRTSPAFVSLITTGVGSIHKTTNKQESKITTALLTGLSTKQENLQESETRIITVPSLFTPTETNPLSVQSFSFFGEPTRYEPERVRIPRPEPLEPFGFNLERRKKQKIQEKSFDAQVYFDATKGKKARWQTVADNVSEKTALGVGSRIVDTTASNKFRVIPQKGKVRTMVDASWETLQGKFREYTIKSKVKVGLRPRNYIEKRKYRIDTPQERQQISNRQVSLAGRFGKF